MTNTANTRISLYKLFLETTVWVEFTPQEMRRMQQWMRENCSRTAKRNPVNNLYETFVWFPTTENGSVWAPLAHYTRFVSQVEMRIGSRANEHHPNVQLLNFLRGHRNSMTGCEVFALREARWAEVLG